MSICENNNNNRERPKRHTASNKSNLNMTDFTQNEKGDGVTCTRGKKNDRRYFVSVELNLNQIEI